MILPTCSASLEGTPITHATDRRCSPGCPGRRCCSQTSQNGGKQCVQRGDQGDKANQHRATIMATLKPARMYSPSISKSSDLRAGWTSGCFLHWHQHGRIDQRQHDKGAEHVQYQRSKTYFGSSMVMYAPTMDIDTVALPWQPWCTYDYGRFCRGYLIGNKVFRLTQNQGADGVKGFSLPMPLTLESRKPIARMITATRECAGEYRSVQR